MIMRRGCKDFGNYNENMTCKKIKFEEIMGYGNKRDYYSQL